MRRASVLFFLGITAIVLGGCSGAGSTSSGSNPSGGNGGSSSVTVTVTPAMASIVVNQNLAFQATVTGSMNTAVTWQVSAVTGGNATVGTISTSGVYTAPAQVPNPATVSVTAVSQADPTKSGSVSVQILACVRVEFGGDD